MELEYVPQQPTDKAVNDHEIVQENVIAQEDQQHVQILPSQLQDHTEQIEHRQIESQDAPAMQQTF